MDWNLKKRRQFDNVTACFSGYSIKEYRTECMAAYTRMIRKLNACLECNSAAEALGILDGDLYYAIFGTHKTSKINTRVLDPDMWIRQKEEIIKFKREIFHDGDNVFRVIVHLMHDNDRKIFPVRKEGGENDFLYSFAGHEGKNFEIWISRLYCMENPNP